MFLPLFQMQPHIKWMCTNYRHLEKGCLEYLLCKLTSTRAYFTLNPTCEYFHMFCISLNKNTSWSQIQTGRNLQHWRQKMVCFGFIIILGALPLSFGKNKMIFLLLACPGYEIDKHLCLSYSGLIGTLSLSLQIILLACQKEYYKLNNM